MTDQDSRKMYLNPFNDFGFKRLFANPKHPGPLRDFITHALEPFGVGEIIDTELLDRDLMPDALDLRGGKVDVLCRIPYPKAESAPDSGQPSTSRGPTTLQGGEQIIVEMQLCEQKDFLKRVTYYTSGIYRNQLLKGEWYDKLRPVYMIALLDFSIFPGIEPFRWHTTCCLKTKEPTVGNIFVTTIELPKFAKTLSEFTSPHHAAPLDEWIYILRHIREWDQFPAIFSRPALTEVGQILWEGALTPQEQRAYEKIELDWQTEHLIKRDHAAKVEALQEGVSEAKKQGIIEGEKRGEKRGEQKGRRELAAMTARKLLARGLNLLEVAKILEMTEDELSKILQDL